MLPIRVPVNGRKSFICFDNDATIKNIKQAIEKGFDVPELIKRLNAAELGPGQGCIPGHNIRTPYLREEVVTLQTHHFTIQDFYSYVHMPSASWYQDNKFQLH